MNPSGIVAFSVAGVSLLACSLWLPTPCSPPCCLGVQVPFLIHG
jgi:hypothetical protein